MSSYVISTLHAFMNYAANDIGRAVRPIYFATKHGRAEHLGSCILAKLGGRHLLLTAAHVVDANKMTSLYIPINGVIHRLEGSGIITVAPNGDRDQDHFDFAVLELSSALIGELVSARFIQEAEIHANPTRGKAYMAFGYPTSQNKRIDHRERKIRSERFSYGGPLIFPNALAPSEQDGEHLLRMKYEKQSKSVEGQLVNSISPRGISGGALFDLGHLIAVRSHPDAPKLAGLLIENRREERSICATRIRSILSVM